MKRSLRTLPSLLVGTLSFLLLSLPAVSKFNWEDFYHIEPLLLPPQVDPQIGGLDVDKEGNLAICLHRGEVLTYAKSTQEWTTFATGLHEPLGLKIEEDGSIAIIQRAELTRLIDENGDGKADLYETLCSDWGLTGNYHEFAFGLEKDSGGNYYIGLGTASNGSGVRDEIRGEWNSAGGLTHDHFTYKNAKEWSHKKKDIPRMYARVPYRGCILKISPDNKKAQVYATGLRTPNGLYMDKDDQLWVNDNQGDWVGASKLHRIKEGAFHGHVASLLWGENPPTITPVEMNPDELNAMRVKGVALLPQGICGNSITQMKTLRSSFAPVRGSKILLMGEMNHARLPLYFPDIVKGQHQGAITHFLNTPQIGGGVNRISFSPEGNTLYTGRTHLSWAGKEGIQKVTYNGKPYLQVQEVNLHPNGFIFRFNAPVKNAEILKAYTVESYKILYHSNYGSPKADLMKNSIKNISVEENTIIIQLDTPPAKNRVYDITLPHTTTSDLGDLSSSRFWYTAHEVYGEN